MSAPLFATVDTDDDGQISRSEWDAHFSATLPSTGGAGAAGSSGSSSGTTK